MPILQLLKYLTLTADSCVPIWEVSSAAGHCPTQDEPPPGGGKLETQRLAPFLKLVQFSMVLLALKHGQGLSCNCIMSQYFLLPNPAFLGSLQVHLSSTLFLCPELNLLATALTPARNYPRPERNFHTDFLGSFLIVSPQPQHPVPLIPMISQPLILVYFL